MKKNVLFFAVAAAMSQLAVAQTDPYENQAAVLEAGVPENKAKVEGINSIAISNSYTAGGAISNGYNSIAIGVETVADKQYGIAIGNLSTSTSEEGISIGSQTKASGESSVSVGSLSDASGNSSIAVGRGANASGETGTSVGSGSIVNAKHGSAFGADSKVTGIKGTAVGVHALASGESSTAVGSDSKAEALYSSAFGNGATATGRGATAIGLNALADGGQGIAVGRNANSSGELSIAQGSAAKATGLNSIAHGTLAVASHEGAVALGSESETKEAVHITEATVEGITYNTFAGVPVAVVSVGKEGMERQIVNVAPGAITETSTDAINGSQLYLVAGQVGKNTAAIEVNAGNIANNAAGVATNAGNINALNIRMDAAENTLANHSEMIWGNKSQIEELQAENAQQALDIIAAKSKVKAGTNVSVAEAKNSDGSTTYTVSSEDTVYKAASGSDALTVNTSGSTLVDGKTVFTQTLDLSDATKATLAKVDVNEQNIQANADKIATNKAAIEANAANISVNAADIADIKVVNAAQDKAIAAAKTEVKGGENVTTTTVKGKNGQDIITVNAKDTSASVSAGSSVVEVTKGATTKVGGANVTDYSVDLSAQAKEGIARGLTAVQTVKAGENTTVVQNGDVVTVNAKDTQVAAGSTAVIVNNVTTGLNTVATVDLSKATKASLAKADTALQNVNAGSKVAVTKAGDTVTVSALTSEVKAGENVTVAETKGNKGQSIYTITAKSASVEAGNGIEVASTEVGNNTVYQVKLAETTQQQINANTQGVKELGSRMTGVESRVDGLSKRIDDVNEVAESAGAIGLAAAQIDRPNEAGKSAIGVAVSGFRSTGALAVGYATNSDDNKWTVKGTLSATTRGHVGAAAGVMYQW